MQVQVLWKLSPLSPLDDDFRAPLEKYVKEGRLRISPVGIAQVIKIKNITNCSMAVVDN